MLAPLQSASLLQVKGLPAAVANTGCIRFLAQQETPRSFDGIYRRHGALTVAALLPAYLLRRRASRRFRNGLRAVGCASSPLRGDWPRYTRAMSRIACAAEGEETVSEEEAKNIVLCFDFDGVVCDSVDESSVTAWKHAKKLWSGSNLEFGKSPRPFLKAMRKVRPVVETGWENTLLLRLLSDSGVGFNMGIPKGQRQVPGFAPVYGMKGNEDSGVPNVGSNIATMVTDSILKSWDSLKESKVKEWNIDVGEMIRQYGDIRDRWIETDKADWLAWNQPYEGVPDIMDAMISAGAEVFVITTKQKRFCAALLSDFGLDLPDDHLFGLEDGPKIEVLRSLKARPEFAGKDFHFVEDKLSTLRKVHAEPDLKDIELYLAEWGYITQRDRKIVKAGIVDGVTLLSFEELEVLGTVDPWL